MKPFFHAEFVFHEPISHKIDTVRDKLDVPATSCYYQGLRVGKFITEAVNT